MVRISAVTVAADNRGRAVNRASIGRKIGRQSRERVALALGSLVILGHTDIDEVAVKGHAAQVSSNQRWQHLALERDRTIGGYSVQQCALDDVYAGVDEVRCR